MLKSQQFIDSLASVGRNVEVFNNALILKPEAIKIGDYSRVDDFSRLEGGQGLEIGRYVHISSFCSISAGGSCLLGDYACMAQGSRILTGSEQLDAAMSTVAPPEWRRVQTATVIVDHLAFLAANSVCLPGIAISIGGVLGAGAVATRDVGAWEIWAGVPARKIGERDPDLLRQRGIPVDELAQRSLIAASKP